MNNTERKYGKMACFSLEPTDADTLVLVNKVVPSTESIRTSENTLMLSSPNTYRKLLADSNLVIEVRSVESLIVIKPAVKLTKSL